MGNMTCYYTFGVDHELAGCVKKITAPDPRAVMMELYGRDWCWEYFPDEVKDNGDGTVTIHGSKRDYTYKLI